MSDTRFQMILQAIITVALLAFAFAMEAKSPGMAQTITGAIVYHWLRESGEARRQATQNDAIGAGAVKVEGEDVTVQERAGTS